MVNNSDGLSPILRPQLGVGWNRDLPSPFGFDNGYFSDRVNDYFTIPRLIGTYLPNDVTIEFWMKNSTALTGVISIGANAQNNGINIGSETDGRISSYNGGALSVYRNFSFFVLPSDSSRNYYSYSFSRTIANRDNMFASFNGIWNSESVKIQPSTGTNTIGADGNYGEPVLVQQAYIGSASSGYYSARNRYVDAFDEFRIYRKILSESEVNLNYNAGHGENPCSTETLLVWYKFEEFENLDFSPLQDNSDIRLGIRDLSGNNNHANPVNMDTNPASPNYVLKPF